MINYFKITEQANRGKIILVNQIKLGIKPSGNDHKKEWGKLIKEFETTDLNPQLQASL